MLVRRSDVSFFCSIHRERCVTGAKAMSTSLAGNGGGSSWPRTNASRVGTDWPGSTGFHRVAGAVSDSSSTFRGPTRRSSSGAIDRRQVSAAIFRSSAVIVTCESFSASANVDGETAGPVAGAVANVGGAPGVADGGVAAPCCASSPHAIAAATTPSGVAIRNCRRVFMPKDTAILAPAERHDRAGHE